MLRPRFHNKEAKIKYKEFAKMDSTGASSRKIDTEMERAAALAYLKTANLDAHDTSIFVKRGKLETEDVVDTLQQTIVNEHEIDSAQNQVVSLISTDKPEQTIENTDTKIDSKKRKFWQKFHNPKIKEMYYYIASKSQDVDGTSKKKIDTQDEQQMIINLIYNVTQNGIELDSHDLALLMKLGGLDSNTMTERLPQKIIDNYNIEEVGENTTLIVENDKMTIVNQPEEQADVPAETETEPPVEDTTVETEEPKTKEYAVKGGDYWYKIVSEQYDAVSGKDINAIVRKLKDEYFEAHKEDLIRQGFTSSRAGFFPKAKETIELPSKIEINGKCFKLK